MGLFVLVILAIAFIILATIRFKMHPFMSLVIAALAVGLLSGIEPNRVVSIMTDGFGETLSSIGFIIVFGTIIGMILERTNGTEIIVSFMLKWFGQKRSPLAMNLTGFIVSIPVFCDSAFVILSSINKTLSKRTGISLTVFAVALATGLYAAHVFIPPTPGPLAAAALLGADLGSVILYGILIALPVSLIGLIWAKWSGKSQTDIPHSEENSAIAAAEKSPSGNLMVFLPILVPILLIGLRSVGNYPSKPFGEDWIFDIFDFIGNPIIALLAGVALAFIFGLSFKERDYFKWTTDALKEAGTIILITGAGGAFGAVLKAMNLAEFLDFSTDNNFGGLIMAFGIASILKSAQGSSTVAIVTASALIAPLLNDLGLDDETGRTFAVLAIGAGAMTMSHLNDSYFWVVSQFSHLSVKTALRKYSVGTLIQGVAGIGLILLLYLIVR